MQPVYHSKELCHNDTQLWVHFTLCKYMHFISNLNKSESSQQYEDGYFTDNPSWTQYCHLMLSAWLSVALLENLFLSISEGCIFTCCAYTNDQSNDLLSATWVLISCYCSVKLITKRDAWQQLDMVSLITVTGSQTRPNDTTVRMCLFILSLCTLQPQARGLHV